MNETWNNTASTGCNDIPNHSVKISPEKALVSVVNNILPTSQKKLTFSL